MVGLPFLSTPLLVRGVREESLVEAVGIRGGMGGVEDEGAEDSREKADEREKGLGRNELALAGMEQAAEAGWDRPLQSGMAVGLRRFAIKARP